MLSPTSIVRIDSGLWAAGPMSPGYFAAPRRSVNRASLIANKNSTTAPP